MHTSKPNEGRSLQPTAFSYSHQLQSEQIVQNLFAFFTNFPNITSKYWQCTLREVLAKVFVDEDSDFDSDIKLKTASVQNQSARHGANDSFQALFGDGNTVVTPQIFTSLSFTDCWKILNGYLSKIKHSIACSFLILCAKFGGSTLCRSGDNEL